MSNAFCYADSKSQDYYQCISSDFEIPEYTELAQSQSIRLKETIFFYN